MNPIDQAPRSGDFIILQDAISGSREVGRWAKENAGWVQIDGKPLRLLPTHWLPLWGDAAGSENNKKDLSFLIDSSQPKTVAAKLLRVFTLAFAAVMLFLGGYAASSLNVLENWPTKVLNFDKIVGLSAPRDRADALIRSLAAAREEIGLNVARENAAQAEALEAKRIAGANQNELKQALDTKTAQADKLARDLAAEISITTGRVDQARAETVQLKQISDAKEKQLQRALDETMSRAETLERELTSVRESISTDGKVPGVSDTARNNISQSEPLNRPPEQSNDAPVIIGAAPIVTSPDGIATRMTNSSVRSTPASTTLAAENDISQSEPLNGPPEQSNDTTVIIGAAPIIKSPDGITTGMTISSADEARLLARAEFFIKQSDIAGARLLLEHGMEKGSTRAIFMLAETYDDRTLRSAPDFGIHPDTEKARELYELAAAAGMNKARERLEALKSSSGP
jgi:TPR repeat protein